MTIAAGTRIGPYEVVSQLGVGGMGEVYRARDTRLGRLVALKILPEASTAHPETVLRFEREARAASALNHPNICTVYDVGVDETPYLAMELLEGETLQTRLTRGPLEIPHLVDIGIALADALETAHARGIIHRDVKPGNIFLTARGPKVLDFGLAKTAPVAAGAFERTTIPPEARLTGADSTVGTVAYMSPEQVRGEPVDARTDVFSLGVVLYEGATGRPPFTGSTAGVISGAILHTDPPEPRQIRADMPARLEDAILKALEKDRDVRSQTASELRADLKRLIREIGSGPTPSPARARLEADTTSDPAPASSDAQIVAALATRHRWTLAVLAVIGIAIAAAAYLSTTRRLAPRTNEAEAIENLQIRQLTSSGNAERPAVSPDGKYVAYVQHDGNDYSLWIRQIGTASNVKIVAAEPQQVIFGATVSPDGAFVHFVRGVARSASLWRVPFLGGNTKKLIDEVGTPVGWSPDGQHMAFIRSVRAVAETTLVVADADGRHERVLIRRQTPYDVVFDCERPCCCCSESAELVARR